jgi:hypothetical protein
MVHSTQIPKSSPTVPLSNPCAYCNQVIESERYTTQPNIICPKAKETAIAAGEKAFKVKDKVVIHDVSTRTIVYATPWRSGDTCPGCGEKVPDKIGVDDAVEAYNVIKDKVPTIECSDRYPLCLNSAPIVQRYKDSDWSKIRFGVTKFRSRIAQFPQFKLSQEAPEPILITKHEPLRTGMNFSPLYPFTRDDGTIYPEKLTPGVELSPNKKTNKDPIVLPFTSVELEEMVYGPSIVEKPYYDKLRPAEHTIGPFMTLDETTDWRLKRMEYRRQCYKKGIMHPPQHKEHVFIDPFYAEHGRTNPEYWRYDLSHRVGFRGKKKITLDYYKFPAQIGKLEQESTGNISWGRYERCQMESKCPLLLLPPKLVSGNPKHIDCHIYTAGSYVEGSPGDKKTSFRAGPLERDEFALKLTGDSFTLVSNPLKVPNPHRIAMMGSMVSPHVSQIGQSLNTKKMKRGRIYPLQKCGYRYCDEVLYYRNRGEIVCDKCQTVHDKIIVTTEYMNRIWDDWGEFEKPVTLGKEIARTLNKRDIQARQVGRICADIGCDIFQLQASTVWQHQFLKRFEELYQIHLEHQGIASKIKMFMEKIEVSRC